MRKSEFRQWIKMMVIFITVFFIMDLIFGSLAKQIFLSQKTGKYARVTYTVQKDTSDIIIMGSSHANRHYLSDSLEKPLHMSCYNAGVQGQRLLFHLALQQMILKRHIPKCIILNVEKDWMYESIDTYDRLSDLYPYYWDYKNELDPIFSLDSRLTKYKLIFKSYQTNSTIVHAVKYLLVPQIDYKGYRPLYGTMKEPDSSMYKVDSMYVNEYGIMEIDTNLVNAFRQFILNAKRAEIDLVFIVSPYLNRTWDFLYSRSEDIMRSIALENHIPWIDFSKHESFVYNWKLFYDASHLNDQGAKLYTKLVSEEILLNDLANK